MTTSANIKTAAVGQLVAAILTAGVILIATWFVSMSTGLLQHRNVQIATSEAYDSSRWSIHFLGASVQDSEPLFRIACIVLLIPSVVVAALVWRHFGRRWGTS